MIPIHLAEVLQVPGIFVSFKFIAIAIFIVMFLIGFTIAFIFACGYTISCLTDYIREKRDE